MEFDMDPDSTEMASWRTVMAFVREQVKIDFPQQHAHVDGPNTRQLFPLKTSVSTSLVLQIEEDEVILKAGLVSGVHVGNVYGLMPHGSKQKQLGRATVTEVVGLNSLTELELFSEIGDHIPKSGVPAFLEHEAFPSGQLPFLLTTRSFDVP